MIGLEFYSAGVRTTGIVWRGWGVMKPKEGAFMARKNELSKEEKIKREKARIKRALSDLDKNKLAVVSPLIDTVAFTAVSIEELQQQINENGYTVEYKNGENQFGTKQSDEVKTLLSMQKNLTAAIKTLADIAPASKSKKSRLQELRGE